MEKMAFCSCLTLAFTMHKFPARIFYLSVFSIIFSDFRQITFVVLNRFCPLNKPPPQLPLPNEQYQFGWNIKQN